MNLFGISLENIYLVITCDLIGLSAEDKYNKGIKWPLSLKSSQYRKLKFILFNFIRLLYI